MVPREPDPVEVTQLLHDWRGGGHAADARLLDRVYRTLRNIAVGHLRRERASHTLQPTALVNEAYIRLVGQREIHWRDRAHFFGLAAMTMRRILVDHARKRKAKKRHADELEPLSLVAAENEEPVDLLDLDRALVRFAQRFPRQARVVELRYFGGLEFDEVARALDLSLRTVKRDWTFARAWLSDALGAPA